MGFKLGTVVSLKSNGLLPAAKYHFLNLGGNENFVTPLMVVVEILFGTQPQINEETGKEKISKKGKNKYKCIFFSNKAMKIQENWFDEKELIQYSQINNEIHNVLNVGTLKYGDVVRFKTVDVESGKKKSFNELDKKKGSKPLLAFAAPAFQVVGFAQVDKKEPILDAYTGEKKREKSCQLVKCKFFNIDSDKFSEQLIPIECLQNIDNSNLDERLEKISVIIEIKEFGLIEVNDLIFFGRPISVHVISGRYQLIFWNELLKKNELFWLDEINDIKALDHLQNSQYFPGVHKIEDKNVVIDVHEYVTENVGDIDKLKIVYRNLKEEIVSRYISVKDIQESTKENASGETPYYLKAHCYLREAEREFRSDRILSLRTIENKDLIDLLNLQMEE